MVESLLDTNVLVHAAFRRSPWHGPAAGLVDVGLRRRGLFCVAPQVLVEFASVVTRPGFVSAPLSPAEAARMARVLYRSRKLRKIYPSRGTVSRTIQEGRTLGAAGTVWYDLFLAVTMRDAGVSVVVTENVRDFRRFPWVKVRRIGQAAAGGPPGDGQPG